MERLEAEFRAFRERAERENADLRRQIEDLRQRAETSPPGSEAARRLDDAIAELQVRLGALADRQARVEAAGTQRTAWLDLSFDVLAAVGGSEASDEEIGFVQPGGHDPAQRGFTIQNAELSLQGAVDPNFRGDAHVILQIDPEGETLLELEEAYLTTLTLPEDLQLKVGQYFTEFGRLNRQHPHEWDFVDQPLVNGRVFGPDGLRAPGARLSWLAPTPFFLELQSGIQNPRGETQTSFFGNEETNPALDVNGVEIPAALGGHPLVRQDVRDAGDLLFAQRASAFFEIGDEFTLSPGGSFLLGPNGTGSRGETRVFGADLYATWRPVATDQGWPFVRAQTEFIARDYDADVFLGDLDGDGFAEAFPRERFRDLGAYGQLVWGFVRPWAAGLRADWVDGNGASTGGLAGLDRRVRLSPNLTYYPSEFSRIRLQANFDRVQGLADSWFFGLWLQFEILLGAHGAHAF